jgi:hypothetical protein
VALAKLLFGVSFWIHVLRFAPNDALREASRGGGRLEVRWLFDLAHLAFRAALALEGQLHRPLVVSRGRDCHDRQFVLTIRERILE